VRTAFGHHKLPAGTVFSFTDGHATFMDSGVIHWHNKIRLWATRIPLAVPNPAITLAAAPPWP
jgi:hypothetical protein